MREIKRAFLPLGIAAAMLATTGCFLFSSKQESASKVHLAPLTQGQAMADFDEIVSKIRALYGPLRYKEERFGYKFDDLVAAAKREIATAKSDEAFFGAYARFLTKLKDGHVSIQFPVSAGKIKRYVIPVVVAPFADNKIGVVSVDPGLASTGIKAGDELVSVDGVSAQDLEAKLTAYTAFGNPVSDRHNATFIFRRKSFMSELIPTAPYANATFKRPDGATYSVSLLWAVEDYFQKPGFVERVGGVPGRPVGYAAVAADYNDATRGTLFEMGANKPYFLNPVTQAQFDVQEIELSPEMQKKYGLTKPKYDEVYAATYNMAGVRVLLLRQPGYAPDKYEDVALLLNVYRAVLEQTQDKVVGLVIDQNHNPGGYLTYGEGFFRLFAKERGAGVINRLRTDRKWIVDFMESAKMVDKELKNPEARAIAYYGSLVEKANEAGEFLSPPVPISQVEPFLLPDDQFTWKKPFIILADELSGSCGDIVPMLLTRNKTAKFFGQRTMGLGGNVEEVAKLSESGAALHLTRGLFNTYREDGVYPPESWVENNGIQPDSKYEMSIDDFRTNYVKYMTAFTTYLLEQPR